MKVESRRRSVRTKGVLVFSLVLGAVAASTGVVGKPAESSTLSPNSLLLETLYDRVSERREILPTAISFKERHQRSFAVGRDFSLAAFNASRLKKDQHATKHLIVDLVYLMDRIEGEREAETLREALKKVVKDKSTAEQISSELNDEARRYRSRLKSVDRWYFDVGFTAIHLACASYHNLEASVRTDLLTLRELRATPPEDVPADELHKLSEMERFIGSARFDDEDFQKLFYATWGLLEVFGG